ncbi:hypothetical protein ABH310_03795, partial [Chromobacterium piscinae]
MAGVVDGREWRLGSAPFIAAWLGREVDEDPEWLPDCTQVLLADADGVQARFAIGDACRDDAAALVAELSRRGLAVHLLSGDVGELVLRRRARAPLLDAEFGGQAG